MKYKLTHMSMLRIINIMLSFHYIAMIFLQDYSQKGVAFIIFYTIYLVAVFFSSSIFFEEMKTEYEKIRFITHFNLFFMLCIIFGIFMMSNLTIKQPNYCNQGQTTYEEEK